MRLCICVRLNRFRYCLLKHFLRTPNTREESEREKSKQKQTNANYTHTIQEGGK